MRVFWLAALPALMAIGCGKQGPTHLLNETGSLAIAQQFGDAVLAQNWDVAYALTTPAFQALHPRKELEATYWKLASSIRNGGVRFAPNAVKVKVEHLPASESEARDVFAMTPVPPYATWRGRVSAEIGNLESNGRMELGSDIYCRMLVVQSGDNLRIGFVSIEFAG